MNNNWQLLIRETAVFTLIAMNISLFALIKIITLIALNSLHYLQHNYQSANYQMITENTSFSQVLFIIKFSFLSLIN